MAPISSLPRETREGLRVYSKLLFGNRDRLDVAVAVAQAADRVVNATDIGFELRLAPNRVRAQLEAFAALGYLTDSSPGFGGKRWFIRGESPFWSLCLALYEERRR